MTSPTPQFSPDTVTAIIIEGVATPIQIAQYATNVLWVNFANFPAPTGTGKLAGAKDINGGQLFVDDITTHTWLPVSAGVLSSGGGKLVGRAQLTTSFNLASPIGNWQNIPGNATDALLDISVVRQALKYEVTLEGSVSAVTAATGATAGMIEWHVRIMDSALDKQWGGCYISAYLPAINAKSITHPFRISFLVPENDPPRIYKAQLRAVTTANPDTVGVLANIGQGTGLLGNATAGVIANPLTLEALTVSLTGL